MSSVETEPRLRGRESASEWWRALRLDRPLGTRELLLAWGALAVLGALAFLPHVIHGGFYLDDWSNGAGTLEPSRGSGIGDVLSYFNSITVYRPVLIFYVPLTYVAFGTDMAMHLAWAAVLAVIVVALLYAVLRTLGVPWIHAFFVSALALLYPWFDSTRFWATADQVSLALAFASAGLWVALVGLDRRSWRWHAVAALLYMASILTYEVALPAIAAFGVLYLWRAGWRRARLRWAVDVAVALAGAVWVGAHTDRTKSGISATIEHLGEIIEGGAGIVGRTLIPVGGPRTTLSLLALAAVFLLGLVALLAWPRLFRRPGWGLRGWLLLGGGGLALTALGWTMFIPADPYYTPVIWGMTNRVNGLAGIGAVILIYAALGVVGTLAAQAVRAGKGTALLVTALLALLVGTGYVSVIHRHTGIWNSAYAAEATAIERIKSHYPTLPEGTTLYTAGYPANQTLGVPIFTATWDLDGMLKVEYEDPSLSGYPVIEGLRLVCRREGVALGGEGLSGELTPWGTGPKRTSPYGLARMLNLTTGQSAMPRNQRQCRAVVGNYVPGMLYISTQY